MRIALVVSVAIVSTTAVWAQSGDQKANISITGCLLSQGYATFVLDDARIDATGDHAAASAPTRSSGPRLANEPVKWVLDEAGNVRAHVGEQVQVIGVTDWKRDDPAPTDRGTAAPTPHVTVITIKYISASCQ